MEDANGFRVDVAGLLNAAQDNMIIRINVGDFDEAYEFLTARGFKNPRGDKTVETATNKSALMISPSGFSILIAD